MGVEQLEWRRRQGRERESGERTENKTTTLRHECVKCVWSVVSISNRIRIIILVREGLPEREREEREEEIGRERGRDGEREREERERERERGERVRGGG